MGVHTLKLFARLSLSALACGCAATRPPAVVETPEGVIQAADEATAERCAQLLPPLDAYVRERLQTTNRRRLVLSLGLHDLPAADIGGTTSWDGVRVRADASVMTLLHELVHWHAVDYWETLPAGIEEGLAPVVAGEYLVDIVYAEPDEELIERVLTIRQDEWNEARTGALNRTAVWTVLAIGVEELRVLAQTAEREGYRRIPTSRLRERLANAPRTDTNKAGENGKTSYHWMKEE